jgi:cytidylate kinase
MIRALTISRQFGSGGSIISRMVAERLNWRLVDREIIDEVVRISGVDREAVERWDEQLDPVFYRMLKSLWQGGFERATAPLATPLFDSSEMTRCSRSVIEKAASGGNCVIVGRGSQCLLGRRPDTLHVFIWAPRAYRIRRVQRRLPDERNPEALMERTDRARNAFIRREWNANWCDHHLYDLMLNSALGDQATADCIVAAVEGASRTHA